MLIQVLYRKAEPNLLHSKKKKKKNPHSSVELSEWIQIFIPSQQVLEHTSIGIQTNSASTCHTLPYPSKDARGFPYFSCCADNACYKIFFRVNTGFINHWLHDAPQKRNLGRPGHESVPARQWAHPTTNQAIVITTNPSWTERSVYPFPSIPSCEIPLAMKRSVAAHGFLNKICFNEGYLSGHKVCRSNLETPCIYFFKVNQNSHSYARTTKMTMLSFS